MAKGWATNLKETEEEARRLFGDRYIGVRYEDLLSQPFEDMRKLWKFLGVKTGEQVPGEGRSRTETSSTRTRSGRRKRRRHRLVPAEGAGGELDEVVHRGG